MSARRFISFFKSSPSSNKLSSTAKPVDDGKTTSITRKAVSFVLITVTGGVALSALDDLSIYYGCSSKAMEKASKNQAVKEALGEPMVKGPWYNASLAVTHKRQTVSCTFPVSGPHGNGVFRMKAVCKGDDNWFPFILPRDWEILVMDAVLHLPGNEEKQQTLRISVSGETACQDCTTCPRKSQPEENPEKK